MKNVIVASAVVAFALSASAGYAASCLNTRAEYSARALNEHDLWVQRSAESAPVRVRTSCLKLGSAANFKLNSQFSCLTLGDKIAANASGGGREDCKVMRIEDYAPQEGDSAKF